MRLGKNFEREEGFKGNCGGERGHKN